MEFDRENLKAIDPTTPDGAQVRSRIISRTDQIDGWLQEISDLRQERMEEVATLQGTDGGRPQ